MTYNKSDGDLITVEGNKLNQVDEFKYLGSWIQSSKRDMEIRIGQAWRSLNKDKIWKTSKIKIQFYRATIESVLLYEAESWTLTSRTSKRLDGTYTRMLRAVLGVSWKEHIWKPEQYL